MESGMSRTLSTLLAALLLFALAGPAHAQRQRERSLPEVGDPLPDVAGFDAEGHPFELTRLRGKYTVIVFGCLT